MHGFFAAFSIHALRPDHLRLRWCARGQRASDQPHHRGLAIEPDLAAWTETQQGSRLRPDWLYELGMATAHGFQRDLRAVPGVLAVLETLVERQANVRVTLFETMAQRPALSGLD